jgi:hypothetical protein
MDDGPVVRPYALTGGRVRGSGEFDLLARVIATGAPAPYGADLGPHHRRLLTLMRRTRPLAEIASDADLPLGVVRVLLGDLLEYGLILVRPPAAAALPATASILSEVISGLRAL